MKKYSICDPDTLREHCILFDWFSEGTVRQYNKLFYANAHGGTIEQIAIIIWICSDVSENAGALADITDKLNLLQKAYLQEG